MIAEMAPQMARPSPSHSECPTPSAGRRCWRSRGRACDSGRSAPRSGGTGTAPSAPRSRARSSRGGSRARKSRRRRRVVVAERNRFSDARLQAVSSRNMYSEHGFDARIGPDCGQVCQSLMVVWNWMPGSAEAQAAKPILSQRAARIDGLDTCCRRGGQSRFQSPSAPTALRNSSVTRTELLEFWPETVR